MSTKLSKTKLRKVFSLTLLTSSLAIVSFAQSAVSNDIQKTNISVDNCEISTAKIDTVKNTFSSAGSDSKITIIGAKGRNETAKNINQKRLDLVLKALVKLGIDEKQISVSESKELLPLPTVSFFMDGKLVEEITASTNGLLCTYCCESGQIPSGIFDPFDDYGIIPCNEELGRLDNFAIYLRRNRI